MLPGVCARCGRYLRRVLVSNLESPQRSPDASGESPVADSSSLEVAAARIPPIRGLIPLHNARGKFFSVVDVRRWIRLNRVLHKTEKIDLYVEGPLPETLHDILSFASDGDVGLGVALSLRTDCTAPPDGLEALQARGLADVFLCPPDVTSPHFETWLGACRDLGLPMRVQLLPPYRDGLEVEALALRMAAAGVRVVNVALDDPWARPEASRTREQSAATVDRMAALARALEARDVEANLLGIPMCLVSEEDRVRLANSQQFFLDHQQYKRASYELALGLYPRAPWVVGKILLIRLGRSTSRGTTADKYVLAWLADEHSRFHAAVSAFRKLTRHVGILNRLPKPIENSEAAYRAEIETLQKRAARNLGGVCGACRLRRICDHRSPGFKRLLKGLVVAAEPGEVCVSPLHYTRHQRKYYDRLDKARLGFGEWEEALAQRTNQLVADRPADKGFEKMYYAAHNTHSVALPGAVEWLSLSNGEKVSTVLAWLEAPFTLSLTFGAGIADYIGFSLGHVTKIVCPMEAYSHCLVLHVDRDGRYVLLRDGALVRPVAFEGVGGVPTLAPTVTPVRVSIWNIDRSICTQNLQVWEGEGSAPALRPKVKYSMIIVCMRFSRRLEAVLRSIAHQEGIDFDQLEVIVAFIPGLDATDDVLHSVELAYPHLHIVRSPFTERYDNWKGLVINQSMEMARGDWIILLDSDVLIPPDMFKRMEGVPETTSFIAPDRRKMMTREMTAKILLGEIEPWRQWGELLEGPGEVRVQEGGDLPIGFFQCVRAESARAIKYEEFGHFQRADWDFIVHINKKYGPGTWLKGVTVLHLDHGGSQWYGARKHL